MQIINVSKGVRGFVRLADYAIRWVRMVTEKAKHKARVLAFWQKHGLAATIEAFGVKRRTLFVWKSQIKTGGGKLEALNEGSKRPKHIRTRVWSDEIKNEIKNEPMNENKNEPMNENKPMNENEPINKNKPMNKNINTNK